MRKQTLLVLSLFAATLTLWNCATSIPPLAPRRDADRDALLQRATSLWKAIIAKDNNTILSFLSPAAQEQFSRYQAMGGTTFNTIDFHIDAIEIDPDGVHASVIVTNTFFAPPIPQPRTVPGHVTRWEKINGVWMHYYEPQDVMISGSRGGGLN